MQQVVTKQDMILMITIYCVLTARQPLLYALYMDYFVYMGYPIRYIIEEDF